MFHVKPEVRKYVVYDCLGECSPVVGGTGQGDVRLGEKGPEGVQEAEEKGAGSGRNRKLIKQHCAIFLNRKSAKRR